jgi:hypothetical protein
MFHWLPRRIETHVKICILALLIERVAEVNCGEPWSRVRRKLEELQISEFLTSEHRFFRRNEISAKTCNLLKVLGISTPKVVIGLEKLQKSPSET